MFLNRYDLTHRRPPIQIDVVPDTDLVEEFGLRRYTFNGLSAFCFDDHLDTSSCMVFTNILIPGYFDQVPHEIQGLFLVNLGNSIHKVNSFIEDKEIGSHGCPKRLLTQPAEKGYFTFNKMRFYPFIMTDFSIGYYVCDGKSAPNHQPPLAWPDYSEDEIGIALDYPLTYDATLGIYLTRNARVIRP